VPSEWVRCRLRLPWAPTGTTSSGGQTSQLTAGCAVTSIDAWAATGPSMARTVPIPASSVVTSPAGPTPSDRSGLLHVGASGATVPSWWVVHADRRVVLPSSSGSGQAGEISIWTGATGATSSSAWAWMFEASARTGVVPGARSTTLPGASKYPTLWSSTLHCTERVIG